MRQTEVVHLRHFRAEDRVACMQVVRRLSCQDVVWQVEVQVL